ncbi:ISNCY family transposase [Thermodesulfovibrio hydrogeniphilus]
MKRAEVITQVVNGCMSLRQAQEILRLSYRQLLRIKKRFIQEGFEGLLRKKPPVPQALKITQSLHEQIINLRKSLYWDFNILHFKDKLKECHGINLSYESIRRVLLKEGLHEAKRKRRVYRRRRRMPKAGMLVQMDSSEHRWIEEIEKPWWLVAMIDDADGFVYAEFHPSETVWANLQVIRTYIEQRGLFMALYTDKASHFRTTRHGGLHNEVEVEQKETQIERALNELGIKLINANTPQAKGRIERKFRFFQDRLIKEMRLRGIKNYDEANRFLKEEFLPWCNTRYTLCVESIYMPAPSTAKLDLVFCIKHPRKVNKDNTVRYNGGIYQILPLNGRSLAGKWVEICELRDGRIEILLEGTSIGYVEITGAKEKDRHKKEEEILNLRVNTEEQRERKKYIPPANHPWRKDWRKNVTFSCSNKM